MNKTINQNMTSQESISKLNGKTITVVNLTPDISISDELRSKVSEELYSVFGKYSGNTGRTV